jgi:hypothetical protein
MEMKKVLVALFALAALAACPVAEASTIVDFASCTNTSPVSGRAADWCTATGPNSLAGTAHPSTWRLNSWTEGGYTITPTSTDTEWDWTNAVGDAAASIVQTETTGGNSGSITITSDAENGGKLELISFDFGINKNSGTDQYSIVGYNGSTAVYTIVPTTVAYTASSGTQWELVTLPVVDADQYVTSVKITISDTKAQPEHLDNFDLDPAPVPEPRSLVLLGTGFGLVGLLVFLRHRRAVSHQTIA